MPKRSPRSGQSPGRVRGVPGISNTAYLALLWPQIPSRPSGDLSKVRQRYGQHIINRYPRPVGSLEDPDSVSRPDQVSAIENVEHHDPVCQLSQPRNGEVSGRAEVELPHLWKLGLIRKAAPESAAEQAVESELIVVPAIRRPTRSANQRRVIEHDIVAVDV